MVTIFIIRSKVRPLIEGDTWKPADHPSHPQPACESFSQVGALYGGRHDLIPMLKSANAPGRPYVLLTCDELGPGMAAFWPSLLTPTLALKADSESAGDGI
jgi:hypothetical protein